jgi:hypothetical protein
LSQLPITTKRSLADLEFYIRHVAKVIRGLSIEFASISTNEYQPPQTDPVDCPEIANQGFQVVAREQRA